MKARHLEILQHALGVDKYGSGEMYRNHYCAGADDEADCRELVALGHMRHHATTKLFPDFNCSVTAAGRIAMAEASQKPPKLTRSQHRYRRWLSADCDMKFGEWLKHYGGAR